jgi:hypothetical protein
MRGSVRVYEQSCFRHGIRARSEEAMKAVQRNFIAVEVDSKRVNA